MTVDRKVVAGEQGRTIGDRGTIGPSVSFFRKRYRASVRPTVKVLARIHLGLLRAGRGGVGRRLFGGRMILLTTVGRRSGRERTTPLAYMKHGDSLVVAASCAGSDRPPDWWLNLQRQPRAVIEMAGVKSAVYAHRPETHMLKELTPEFEACYPQMQFYQRMSRREIPLIILRPLHEQGTKESARCSSVAVPAGRTDRTGPENGRRTPPPGRGSVVAGDRTAPGPTSSRRYGDVLHASQGPLCTRIGSRSIATT
jgi:deazaflavin-dependent oxidoreductase (nitroreductase family)